MGQCKLPRLFFHLFKVKLITKIKPYSQRVEFRVSAESIRVRVYTVYGLTFKKGFLCVFKSRTVRFETHTNMAAVLIVVFTNFENRASGPISSYIFSSVLSC